MNAYELADTLKAFVEQIKPTNNESDDAVIQGLPNWFIEQLEQTVNTLYKQQDYIAELKENYTSACLEMRDLGRENVDLYDKIKALKAKTLTDEVLMQLYEVADYSPESYLEEARAILRKAQEK